MTDKIKKCAYGIDPLLCGEEGVCLQEIKNLEAELGYWKTRCEAALAEGKRIAYEDAAKTLEEGDYCDCGIVGDMTVKFRTRAKELNK